MVYIPERIKDMNLEDLQKIAYIKYVDVCRGDTCERLPFLKRRLDNKEKYEIVALKVEIETNNGRFSPHIGVEAFLVLVVVVE